MIGRIADHGSSPQMGAATGDRGLVQSDKLYFLSRNSGPPHRETQNCHAAYTAIFFSLIATVYLIFYGSWCLRNLDLAHTVEGGLHERVLSLAETGSLKKCMGDNSEQLTGASPSSPRPLGPTMQLISASIRSLNSLEDASLNEDNNESSVPTKTKTKAGGEEHTLLERTRGGGNQQVELKTTLRNKQVELNRSVQGGEQRATPKCIVDGGNRHDPCIEEPTSFYLVNALATIPDEAELRRLQKSLLIPAEEAKNLTEKETVLIREANDKLLFFMERRYRLAAGLRKAVESRQRLVAYAQKLGGTERSCGTFGRFTRFVYTIISRELRKRIYIADSKILEIGANLNDLRGVLKGFLRRREQRALSLRIMASKRQSGLVLTTREANALGVAKLVVNGSRKKNYLPTRMEGKAIVDTGFKLLAALQDARLRLSSLMEEATSESGCGSCAKCVDLKEHLERCDALHKEASTYALKLRSLTLTFFPEQYREIIIKLEREALQLRKKTELAVQSLQCNSPQREEAKPLP